jgi:myo-inositol-1(or 4)-monophosphatase
LKIKNQDLLKLALIIATKAGKKLSKKTHKSLHQKSIHKHDLKLKEDEETELFISKFLLKATGIPILGEEDRNKPDFNKGKFWIVDPIDGTVNFSRGIPIASVSIALWEDENPILGVVYDIFNEIIYSGIVGKGAKRNGKNIAVSNILAKSKSILLTGLPVKSTLDETIFKQWFKYFDDFHKVRMIGSASISLCYVASGIADVYREDHIQIWDVAAGLAIVKSAGGKIEFKKSGKSSFSYYVVATNGHFKI